MRNLLPPLQVEEDGEVAKAEKGHLPARDAPLAKEKVAVANDRNVADQAEDAKVDISYGDSIRW